MIRNWARPSPETVLSHRLLVFLGSGWLLLSWILVIGLKQPLLPTVHTWLPGVRMMLVMASIGLVVVWPMAAMTTARAMRPGRTLRESIILLILAQLIIWPAGLVTAWTPGRTSVLALALIGWGLVAAAVTAWGRVRPRAMERMAAMSICLLIMLVAVIISLADPSTTWAIPWSPATNLWSLAGGGIEPPRSSDWIHAAILWAVAVVGWTVLLACPTDGCRLATQTRGSST